MRFARIKLIGLTFLSMMLPAPVLAHPVPFSYIDVHLLPDSIELVVVAHIFDLAHDLNVQPQEKLLDRESLMSLDRPITALLTGRVQIAMSGRTNADAVWSSPEPMAERQAVSLRARYVVGQPLGRVSVTALMFPYDPQHKTFLNIYEGDAIA